VISLMNCAAQIGLTSFVLIIGYASRAAPCQISLGNN